MPSIDISDDIEALVRIKIDIERFEFWLNVPDKFDCLKGRGYELPPEDVETVVWLEACLEVEQECA